MTYTDDINTVLTAGGTVTPEYERLARRRAEFDALNVNLADELTAAVLSDAPLDGFAQLHKLAIASAHVDPIAQATVRNQVHAALEAWMTAEYAQTAEANYDTLRAQFNRDADAFTAAHQIVDANSDPAELVTASDKIRKAWAEGRRLAPALTAQVAPLVTAARLAGAPITNTADPLGVVLATTKNDHRRRVWEAWENGWSAVLDLGVRIHAPELANVTDYAKPLPMETRPVRVDMGAGMVGQQYIDVDPHDADYIPADAVTL